VLTILTLPILGVPNQNREQLIRIARTAKRFVTQGIFNERIPAGHPAVMRSLEHGFKLNGLPVIFNPWFTKKLTTHIHVAAGLGVLRQAIYLKNKGYCKHLSCGPNIGVAGSEFSELLGNAAIDQVVSHCDWAMQVWERQQPLIKRKKLSYWYAGVDHEFWRPPAEVTRSYALIFDKRLRGDPPDRTELYERFIKSLGIEVRKIERTSVKKYTHEQYRKLLHGALFMVGFTAYPESQGIAWVEAWAADVPTFIQERTLCSYDGQILHEQATSCPMISESTGVLFSSFNEFKRVTKDFLLGQLSFKPREWTLQNLTDEISARNFFNQIVA